jgi:hypothetical protein
MTMMMLAGLQGRKNVTRARHTQDTYTSAVVQDVLMLPNYRPFLR